MLVNRLGRVVYAKVAGLERTGVVAIEPLDRRVTNRSAEARQVVDHWAHVGRDHEERPSRERLELEVLR